MRGSIIILGACNCCCIVFMVNVTYVTGAGNQHFLRLITKSEVYY